MVAADLYLLSCVVAYGMVEYLPPAKLLKVTRNTDDNFIDVSRAPIFYRGIATSF